MVALQPRTQSTSRAGYLKSLGELVGPAPTHRSWIDEWVALNVAGYQMTPGCERFANEAYVARNETVERLKGNFAATVDGMMERQWSKDRAELYCLLGSTANALAAALRERSSRFAATTYTLCDTLWEQRAAQKEFERIGRQTPQPEGGKSIFPNRRLKGGYVDLPEIHDEDDGARGGGAPHGA